ncbi:hypothetical protein Ancab_016338 [Ancistrocladus abbreviatus]
MNGHLVSGRTLRNNLIAKKSAMVHRTLPDIVHCSPCILRVRSASIFNTIDLEFRRLSSQVKHVVVKALYDEDKGDSFDEDDELCPVDCVREFRTKEEFYRVLEKGKKTNSLVVIDFYRSSCGSCKYIEQGFSKLCKGSGDQEAPVIFLKHNIHTAFCRKDGITSLLCPSHVGSASHSVMDEYDEQSEVAEELRIKVVPLFHFYKDGVLLEAFPTRDREKITEAILRYTSAVSRDN